MVHCPIPRAVLLSTTLRPLHRRNGQRPQRLPSRLAASVFTGKLPRLDTDEFRVFDFVGGDPAFNQLAGQRVAMDAEGLGCYSLVSPGIAQGLHQNALFPFEEHFPICHAASSRSAELWRRIPME